MSFYIGLNTVNIFCIIKFEQIILKLCDYINNWNSDLYLRLFRDTETRTVHIYACSAVIHIVIVTSELNGA